MTKDVATAKGEDLKLQEFSLRSLGPQDVEVDIAKTSLCHMDAHPQDNEWEITSTPSSPPRGAEMRELEGLYPGLQSTARARLTYAQTNTLPLTRVHALFQEWYEKILGGLFDLQRRLRLPLLYDEFLALPPNISSSYIWDFRSYCDENCTRARQEVLGTLVCSEAAAAVSVILVAE
eukprot:m51a1_g11634 hypothetical protein (177) ;mRNA; r:636-4035